MFHRGAPISGLVTYLKKDPPPLADLSSPCPVPLGLAARGAMSCAKPRDSAWVRQEKQRPRRNEAVQAGLEWNATMVCGKEWNAQRAITRNCAETKAVGEQKRLTYRRQNGQEWLHTEEPWLALPSHHQRPPRPLSSTEAVCVRVAGMKVDSARRFRVVRCAEVGKGQRQKTCS